MPFAVLIPLSAVSAVVTAGWVEGEAWVAQRGSVGRDFKQAASGGELLGANWGGKAGDFARWLFYIPTPQQVAIHIRYSRRSEGPASFKLLVDGTEVVGSPVSFSGGTGGWGEAAEHFRWLSVRSLTLASGFHWLELQAVSDASNTNIDGILVTGSDAAPPEQNEALAFLRPLLTGNAIGGLGYIWIEGEDWSEQNGSTGVDTKPAAVGGQVLGMNWGGGADHWATWEFELSPPGLSNAIACIRYCRLMPGDVEFSVAIDGQPAGDGKVKFSGGTGGWGEAPEHFRVAEVALGDLKPGKHRLRLAAQRDGSNVNIDGIFVAGGGFPRELSPEEEARLAKVYYASSQVAAEPQMRKVTLAEMPPGRPASTISVAEIVGELPPGAQRVVQKLATKPWPNLVAAYDVSPTDYNNDLTWLDLMKEKHFALPHAGRLGLVQPHTDIYVLQEISVVGRETQLQWRPVLHIANALTYRADLDGRSFVELTFLVRDSRTLIGRLLLHNAAGEPLVLRVATTIDHPVDGLPPQRFSRLIPCRTGRLAWASVEEARATAMLCCDEYLPGTSRPTGQVAVCLVGEGKPRAIGFSDKPGGELGRQPGRCCAMVHELTAAPRDRATFRFATSFVFFNERRQVDGPRGTVTYSRMSAEDAARSAYAQAHTALSEDFAQFLARSLDWYSSVPVLDLPHPTWERDFYASLELPRCETLSPHGNMAGPFYNFCRAVGNNLYHWWSYGMHGHESLACFVANIAQPSLSQAFLRGHFQFQSADGGIPYGVSPASQRSEATGTATMPVLTWEAWETYLWSGDKRFLEEAYEACRRFHDWWVNTRDRTGEGLVHWNGYGETVRDDADVPTWLLSGGAEYQEALDLNCYLLMDERCLVDMAEELGRPEEAERWRAAADRRVQTMNSYMWSEAEGCYYGINEVVPQLINIKDCSTFYPLWCGLAPPERALRLVEHLTKENEFWLPFPVPSVARDEPLWGADWHWHGPNWVEMVWPTVRGLRNYGYYELAAELAYRNCEMVFTHNLEADGHFREYYNPLTGKGAAGCLYDYVWACVPAIMALETFAGVRPCREGLEVLPALPRDWDRVSVEGLKVRGKSVSVTVVRRRDVHQVQVSVNERSAPVCKGRGVLIPWSELADGTTIRIIQPWRIPETCSPPWKLPPLDVAFPPHRYPEDQQLIETVKRQMKSREKLGR